MSTALPPGSGVYATDGSSGGDDGEKIRVLICGTCRTIDTLPFRAPNTPGPDPYLDDLVARHNGTRPHNEEDAVLFDTSKSQWENMAFKEKLLKDIKERQQGQRGFTDVELFASRDTFMEDAQKCYVQHGRPSLPGEGCSDYCSPSKLLGRPTPEGRSFAKENPKLGLATGPFLCWHCPFQSYVTTDLRHRRGMYKEN